MPSIEDTLKLEEIEERKFRMLKIQKDCKLRDAVEMDLKLKFKQGHAYYQFVHEKENVSRDRELIFVNKVYKVIVGCRTANNFH